MEARPIAREPGPRIGSERDIKSERAVALARRSVSTAGPDLGIDHLVCVCGAERYGLPLAAVAQVLPMRPCTPMPGAVPALLGLIALSGRIVGVLGLARAMGRPEPQGEGSGDDLGHLVVLRGAPSQPVALAVDRVLGIAVVPGAPAPVSENVDPSGLGNAAASGYAPASALDGRPDFVAIDLPRLLRRVLP